MSTTSGESRAEVNGVVLAGNAALNLVGQVIPLLVGLVTIPYIVRGLGIEAFGVLSIGWVLLGYFGLFDLGLGRATTKFVAGCLGRGDIDQLPSLVWTSLGFQLVLGGVGALLVWAVTPILVNRILKIPPSLLGETKATFFLLAASLPFVLSTNALRGVLEAAQRFDLVNYVKVPANISVFLLPAISLPFGLRLPGIVFLLVLARLGATLAYLALCFHIFPALVRPFLFDSKLVSPLIRYGGWVTVSNVVGPILAYMDRFLIGSLVSMAAVGYYSGPYEALARLSILPGSLVSVLFPAFSSVQSTGNHEQLRQMYVRSVKFILLIVGPPTLFLVVFGNNFLLLWLGQDFASNSTFVFQMFALGFFLNSLLLVPFTLIQGLGGVDMTAKFHSAELLFYVPLLWLLTQRFGIAGAATAWALRVMADGLLLFGGAWKSYRLSPGFLIGRVCARSAFLVAGFGLLLFFFKQLWIALFLQVAAVGLVGIVFIWGAWNFVLDDAEKGIIFSALSYTVMPRGPKN